MQLTLDLEDGISEIYPTCREYVSIRVHQQGKYVKTIAAEMNLSPSHLARKLTQGQGDSMRFTLDDFETYLSTQGDTKPLAYLVEKYMAEQSEIERLRARVAELEAKDRRGPGRAERRHTERRETA